MSDNEPASQAAPQLARMRRAIGAAMLREQYRERTSLAVLTQTGRGVPTDPACRPAPVTGITWSKQAREALPKRGKQ